jgi:hypothetical protein
MEEMRNTYKVLVRKPEGKKPLGRPRGGWENIKMNSCGSGYGPVAGSCEHGNESSGSIKCREFLGHLGGFLKKYSAAWNWLWEP